MKPVENLNGLKSALRDQLCPECGQRRADSAAPPAAAPCENDCTLFVNLPRRARVAKEGEPPCGYEVFAKSLHNSNDASGGPDVVQALTIIEAAGSRSAHIVCGDASGCERLTRVATAVACLRQPAD